MRERGGESAIEWVDDWENMPIATKGGIDATRGERERRRRGLLLKKCTNLKHLDDLIQRNFQAGFHLSSAAVPGRLIHRLRK